MLIDKFEEKEITDKVKKFYDVLADVFLESNYNNDDKTIGRYRMSKELLEKLNYNIDFDYILFTNEGHMEQDELVIKYHKDILINEINDLINEFENMMFYIDPNMNYSDSITNFEWENIKDKFSNNLNFCNIGDYRSKSLSISLGSILGASHVLGSRIVREFLKNKTYIPIDNKGIPITFYFELFKDFDLKEIFNIKSNDKIVFPENNNKDKEFLDKIDEKSKEEFIGQESNISFNDIISKLKELGLVDKIIEYINPKDKKNINNSQNNEYKDYSYNEIKDNKSNEEYMNNGDNKKYILKRNPEIDEKLKEKYNSKEYKDDPGKYIEDTTNRKIESINKENINSFIKENENETKNSPNGLGNIISQKNFDEFRNVEKHQESISFEDILYLSLKNNTKDDLYSIEKSLKKFSCRYIKESLVKKTLNLTKNIFLSKVSNFINDNLQHNNIEYKIDLTDYNYLEYGDKDIDDIKVKGDKRILDYIKLKNLVKESYTLDSKGIRKYPRLRRVLDNILIEYIKNRIKFKGNYFDGVVVKDLNIVRLNIIYWDELVDGMNEKDYIIFENMGSQLNITTLICYLLKNKINNREKLLLNISSLIDKDYDQYVRVNTKTGDKSKLISLFPNLLSLRSFCKLKHIESISNFYISFYEHEDSLAKDFENIVTENSSLKCSLGIGLSKFINLSSKCHINGNKIVCENDKSIIPFQSCSVCKVCNPKIVSNWITNSNIKIKNNSTLLAGAKNFCAYGGILTIENYENKSYKSSINISDDKVKDNKEFSPYKTKEEAVFMINKLFLNLMIKHCLLLSLDNSNLYKLSLNNFIEETKKIFEINLKPKFDELNLLKNYSVIIYSNQNKKIYNISDIGEVIKNYFMSFIKDSSSSGLGKKLYNKYKTNLTGKELLEEYLKNATSIDKIYSESLNRVNKGRPIWMKVLLEEYNNFSLNRSNNSRIREYHKVGGGINADYKTAWCASFANWVLKNSGVSDKTCASSQEMCYFLKKIDKPYYGSILVLSSYNNKGEKTGHGHVTFITDITSNKKQYICLGGNQGGKIKYSKYNIKSKIPIRGGFMKINGIYWPNNYPLIEEGEIK